MSRYSGRHSSSELSHGDRGREEPNRWDRERFERFRSRGPEEREKGNRLPEEVEHETIHIQERETPRRTQVRVQERETHRAPGRIYDERDFDFLDEERYGPPAIIPRPRRTDRELFGDQDPRDVVAERSLAPYRRKSIVEREIDINRIEPSRPTLLRRQSSLDTFDRRPVRREVEEYRIPPNVHVPLPIRRSRSKRRDNYEEIEEIRYRDYSPHGYRDVEIMRERSRVRKRHRARSDLKSISDVKTMSDHKSMSDIKSISDLKSISDRSSSTESFEKVSRHSSPGPQQQVGKKGKTRMPKRLARKEAVLQLGYPFEEEDDFIIVQRALEKEQIDEVIRISAELKGPKTTTYRFEETLEVPEPPASARGGEHYEAVRTEWINPPSIRAPSPARSHRTRRSSPPPSARASSPARSSRTRRSSPARTVRAPSPLPPPPIYIQRPAPPPPRETIYVQQQAPPPVFAYPQPPQQPMTIVLPEHHRHHDRDIKAEIRALDAERDALRYERHVEDRTLVVRRPENFEVVEYRERRPDREVVEYEPRSPSPKRNVIRVGKDKKGRIGLIRSSH